MSPRSFRSLGLVAYQCARTQPALGALTALMAPSPSLSLPRAGPLQKVSWPRTPLLPELPHGVPPCHLLPWRHENSVEQSCEPSHQSPSCILFIENLTDSITATHYYCEAQEDSYLREAQHWELLREDSAMTHNCWATLHCGHQPLAGCPAHAHPWPAGPLEPHVGRVCCRLLQPRV